MIKIVIRGSNDTGFEGTTVINEHLIVSGGHANRVDVLAKLSSLARRTEDVDLMEQELVIVHEED